MLTELQDHSIYCLRRILQSRLLFNIKIHTVSCPTPSYRVSIPKVRCLINPNTILLISSAPNYPHGIVDEIPALSSLAVSNSVPLHVDCYLGSFLIPYLSRAGFASP